MGERGGCEGAVWEQGEGEVGRVWAVRVDVGVGVGVDGEGVEGCVLRETRGMVSKHC